MSIIPAVIDISYCQTKGSILWATAHETIDAVAIRMSQFNFEDNMWLDHAENAIKVGMPFFGWHFVQPNQGPALQIPQVISSWKKTSFRSKVIGFDVENIAYNVTNPDGTVKESVNIEPPSKEKFTLWLMQLIQGVMNGTGLPQESMLIYTRTDYWIKWVLPFGTKFYVDGIQYTSWDWSKCLLWIAAWTNYTSVVNVPPDWKNKNPQYILHQYEGGTGRDKNVVGPTDKDHFLGTYDQLIILFGKPGGNVTDPVVNPTVFASYTAKSLPAWLTVCLLPIGSSNPVRWIPAGTVVTVTQEENGWGFVGDGWVSLGYLGPKTIINPVPNPTPVPVDQLANLLKWAATQGYDKTKTY